MRDCASVPEVAEQRRDGRRGEVEVRSSEGEGAAEVTGEGEGAAEAEVRP